MEESILKIFDGEEIKSLPISVYAARMIRQKIILGEILPDQRLREVELSDALGVSKAAIREALMSLNEEGLLVRVANKYTQVVRFTEKDVSEIFDLRIALEKLCVALCMENSAVPVQSLHLQMDRIGQSMEEKNKKERYVENDVAFHEIIVLASGSKRAFRIWHDLKSQIKMLLYMQLRIIPESILIDFTPMHTELLLAMEAGENQKAQEIMEKHIRSAYERTVQAVQMQGE